MPIIQVGKYHKIDPNKEMHLGHQYEKNGQRAIEKRCDYCGKYFCFDVKNCDKWDSNIKISHNGVPEKIHCGSTHCQDYHIRVVAHEKKMDSIAENAGYNIYRKLVQKGIM